MGCDHNALIHFLDFSFCDDKIFLRKLSFRVIGGVIETKFQKLKTEKNSFLHIIKYFDTYLGNISKK